MPNGNEKLVQVLHLLSTASMLLHKMVAFVHNFYSLQLYTQRQETKQWINKNWAMVAMSAKDLDLKQASDLDTSELSHLEAMVATILVATSVKEMPFGGYYARPPSDTEVFDRVTAKTYNLKASALPKDTVKKSWFKMVAAYATTWEKEMSRGNKDTSGFGELPSTEIDDDGVPVDPDAFFDFVEKHVDPKFIEQVKTAFTSLESATSNIPP